mmetsp:Transcript_3788/g.11227  ORF Transcript_3788/g.11227 Transcript_3788/m.11227 type:complete len:288 (-) Transcript_3788:69-932(-)
MTRASSSPKASIFCPSGVFSSSSAASRTCAWILPISVRMPVPATTQTQVPLLTVVPEKSMQRLSWMRAPFATASAVLTTVSDSPVRAPSSVRRDVVLSSTTRTSAGTLSPTLTCTMSPGTRSAAGTSGASAPSRTTCAVQFCSCLRASSAFSALCSCHTPTMAFRTRISRMTKGSTNACMRSSPSSANARAKESPAAPRRIFTRRSSNCSRTSFQSGVPSSFSNSFGPYFSRSLATLALLRPLSTVTPWPLSTCAAVCAQGVWDGGMAAWQVRPASAASSARISERP